MDKITQQGLVSYIIAYLIIGIPIFVGIILINNGRLFHSFGLNGSILKGVGVSLLFTLPMFLGGIIFFKFNNTLNVQNLIAGTIVAGFMEELYFRGFLFGQLFRKTNFGFITSNLLSALLFASGHLYQSQHLNELVGIFLITFLGAIFFAWLYVEWDYNLWVPIFSHTFINLSWSLFEVDSSALGDVKANIFRFLTITIAIVFTISRKKKNHEHLIIHRKILWKKDS